MFKESGKIGGGGAVVGERERVLEKLAFEAEDDGGLWLGDFGVRSRRSRRSKYRILLRGENDLYVAWFMTFMRPRKHRGRLTATGHAMMGITKI